MEDPTQDVTQLLLAATEGDQEAANQLWAVVYDTLRELAHRRLLGERKDHTLNTTALVHEAYLKLVNHTRIQWQNRSHFYALASTSIRRILVDYARYRNAPIRPHPKDRVPLEDAVVKAEARGEDLLALDEALTQLAKIDERLAKVVEYRFFMGFKNAEIAELLGVATRTIERDWKRAQAHLHRLLRTE